YVVDASSYAVLASANTGIALEGIGVHPDGTRVYLVGGASTALVVDAATNAVTKTLTVGAAPNAFGRFVGGCPGADGDCDGDGVPDATDNCFLPNADQADADGDGVGDLCDNCPNAPNADQADRDGDGRVDATDNCPDVANPGQENADGDGLGDACDPCTDTDRDGFGDPGFPANTCPPDNCPTIGNPGQVDSDHDGRGDACQVCDALTDVDDFEVVTQKVLKVGIGITHGYEVPVSLSGDQCGTRIQMTGTSVDGTVVAVATAGTAMVVKDTVDTPAYIGGILVTGGGKLNAPAGNFVDTSGSDPLVGACRAAQAGAVSASARLAGL